MRPIAPCSAALLVAALLSACDEVPSSTQPSLAGRDVLRTLHGGTADVALTASATILQNGDSWSLAKTGSLSGSTVTWTITAMKTTVATGQLMIDGQLTLTNSGDGSATIGNVVVNLQKRVNGKWVTVSSDVANAAQGDAATTAAIHQKASSEDLGTFAENSASGALEFRDATTNAVVSLVPQVVIGAGESQTLLFSAAFDNSDAALQLTAGTPIRAEVIVTFGNATVNGNSTANVDINGNGTIDADEARVRSVSSRLTLPVPAAAPGSTVTLTDALSDITVTGDVTFRDAQFTLGATTGTVSATVDGGTSGGGITNCAHLTSNGSGSVDLQACSTVNVPASPSDCVPGALGCGWSNGDMRTFTQLAHGDPSSAAGAMVGLNFNTIYGGSGLTIGGTRTLQFTNANAVFAYLPATGPAGVLSGSLTDPITSAAGELGGELLALQLNVDFSAANALPSVVDLGSLLFCNFSAVPTLNGQTVSAFLVAAKSLLGGDGGTLSPSMTASVAAAVNSAFIDGAPSTFAQENLVAGPSCGWSTGDMTTATQNSWGDPNGNMASLLGANFTGVFGASIVIGGTSTATFTDALAVLNYLPATGPAGPLTGNVQDPSTTSSGELGGEVLALKLNVDFSAASVLTSAVPLGNLRICNFSLLSAINGQTVNQFLTTANLLLGGGAAPFGPSSAAAVARLINSAFVAGAPSTFAQTNLSAAPACP